MVLIIPRNATGVANLDIIKEIVRNHYEENYLAKRKFGIRRGRNFSSGPQRCKEIIGRFNIIDNSLLVINVYRVPVGSGLTAI